MTASFLTEDTYLGSINEPLTLNRYNYCISSYPNYEDPSGNSHNEYHPQAEMMEYMYWLTGDEKYSKLAEELYEQQIEMEYYEASTSAGVVDSVIAAPANTVILVYNVGATVINLTQSYFAKELGEENGDKRYEYPVPLIPWNIADNYLENNASKVWNMESYHTGRCGGDILVTAGSLLASFYGIYNICNGLKNVPAWIRSGSNGSKLFVFANGQAAGGTLGLVTSGTKALNVAGTVLADAVAFDALTDFRDRVSRIASDKGSGLNEGSGSEKTVTNSAGQNVTRKYVKNQDELLQKAEEAAGGNLDDFEEIKPGWYQNKEGTIKIEWNPEGHANTNEGPHVTVRHRNERGGWSVMEKYFIEGWDYYQ